MAELDLHVYTVENQKEQDLEYLYVQDPHEVIPDLYTTMLRLEEPEHMVFEDTWFEKMLRDVLGEVIKAPEFTYRLGEFVEALVIFGAVIFLSVFIAIALMGLVV